MFAIGLRHHKSKPLVKIIHQPRAFEPAMSWKL